MERNCSFALCPSEHRRNNWREMSEQREGAAAVGVAKMCVSRGPRGHCGMQGSCSRGLTATGRPHHQEAVRQELAMGAGVPSPIKDPCSGKSQEPCE